MSEGTGTFDGSVGQWDIVVRMCVAAALAGIIGLEREIRNKTNACTRMNVSGLCSLQSVLKVSRKSIRTHNHHQLLTSLTCSHDRTIGTSCCPTLTSYNHDRFWWE